MADGLGALGLALGVEDEDAGPEGGVGAEGVVEGVVFVDAPGVFVGEADEPEEGPGVVDDITGVALGGADEGVEDAGDGFHLAEGGEEFRAGGGVVGFAEPEVDGVVEGAGGQVGHEVSIL